MKRERIPKNTSHNIRIVKLTTNFINVSIGTCVKYVRAKYNRHQSYLQRPITCRDTEFVLLKIYYGPFDNYFLAPRVSKQRERKN